MNINLKSKQMKNMLFKGLFALMLLAGTTAFAQTTSGADNVAQGDAAGVSVKLIDNKGTIKYLQANNGITTLTSTEAGNLTTTTWQLGGELVDDTYIDADGSIFSLDGLKLETGSAATSATNQSGHDASTSGNTTLSSDTGWTLVVRDEATGEIKKLLATELVQSGYATVTAVGADETAGNKTITVTGIPALTGNEGKIWVYRNGAKLLHTTDFTVTTGTSVTVTEVASSWDLYTDDVFEVQWVK